MLTRFKSRVRNFSMIEIVLALVVVVIGLIGIIGLFPIGFDANKQSINKSHASDAAEQFLHFNSSKIKEDWRWSNAFPMNKKYSGDDTGTRWSSTSLIDNPNVKIYFKLNDGDAADVDFNSSTHQSGLYKLEQLSQDKVEFSCIIRGWQTYGSIVLHVECSYPAELPYATRNKEAFSVRLVRSTEATLGKGPANKEPLLSQKSTDNSSLTFTSSHLDNAACVAGLQVNLNPGNNRSNQFCLVTPDGNTYTRTDLLNQTIGIDGIEYIGPATKVFLKPVGNSNNNKIYINGKETAVSNGTTYEIIGKLDVYLHNVHQNHPSNNAMGHWWLCLDAMNATITPGATTDCVSSTP